MSGIRTDPELQSFLQSSKPGTAVIEFGTSWCHKCHEMFPTFFALTKQVGTSSWCAVMVCGRHSA
jgi:thiol-disulfide isomerase/thioredoxin